MDAFNLMGLLGGSDDSPTTTGSVPGYQQPAYPQMVAPAGQPTYAPTGVPEWDAYAQMGIDPRILEKQGWDKVADMGTILMAASGRGVDSSNLGEQLVKAGRGGDESIKTLLHARGQALDAQMAQAKLGLAQRELAARERAEQREIALNRALGLDLSSPDATYGIPQTAPQTAAPQTTGGVPGIPANIQTNDLPGFGGNPKLDVGGTGGGMPAEPNIVQTAQVPEQRVAQAAPAGGLGSLQIVAGVFQGNPGVLSRLGISPEQAASLRVMAASGPEGRNKAIGQILELSQKPRYSSVTNDNGTIITTDQYGNKNAVQAPTQAQILGLEQGKSDIQSRAAETKAQADFARERQKAAEDAMRGEDIANRKAALDVTNKSLGESFKTAQASKEVLEKTNIAEQLMRDGVFSGGVAATTAGAAQATLSRYGLWKNEYAENAQARTVALQNLGRDIAVSIAKSLRPSTDKDVQFAQEIAGLTPDKYDLKTIREVLRVSRSGHERAIGDYNEAASRARKPYEIAGDERSAAAADAAYPKLDVPVRLPNQRKSVNGKTFEFDGNGWFEVR